MERQLEYFDVLEKTERMEMKMDSIKQMKCTAYSCRQVSPLCVICKVEL